MIHTLSISYCGGCNAGYDRVEFITELMDKALREGLKPRMLAQEEAADMASVMAGCQALCVADREDMGGKARMRFVVGPDTLNARRMSREESMTVLLQAMLGAEGGIGD